MVHILSYAVVFILCVTSCYAVKVVNVDAICKNVTDYTFCSNLLNAKPGTSRDLVSLTQYTIDALRVNVTNTVKLLDNLIAHSGSNFNLTYHYNMCSELFGIQKGALHTFEDVDKLFKTGDYESVVESMKTIQFDAFICLSGESPSDPPYEDTSVLPKYVNVVNLVAEIIIRMLSYVINT
ncbi:uncharacterized protein LOC123886549 [Trifolium pratense]|uniref:uncharacterized protein LOC123886549 n=1 Tax=Trifolium pratense TaxID=57577 RepID=UPI001E6927CB|nr:uncharacterized protein LOC123886549 [Trifolium pratense]